MHDVYVALALVGSLLLVLAITAGLIKNVLYLSEPMVAMGLGVAVGPLGLDWFGRDSLDPILLREVARGTLAIAIMGIAIQLPDGYARRHWRSLMLLLGLLMPGMWLVSGSLAYVLLGLSAWQALLVGAIITPTDPVLASSIVTGRLAERVLPERLRDSLSAEAGANDALALPLVMLPLTVMTSGQDILQDWLLKVVIWEIVGALALGTALGWLAGRVFCAARQHSMAESVSFLSVTLALTVAALGLARLVQVSGLLAVFAAGLTLSDLIGGDAEKGQEHIQETVKRFFLLPIFVLFGVILPYDHWLSHGWAIFVLTVLVLLLRRIPVTLLLQPALKPFHSKKEGLFAGWFGPIGIAAMFYAIEAEHRTGDSLYWAVASLVIAASVIVHGFSATPLTKLLGHARR